MKLSKAKIKKGIKLTIKGIKGFRPYKYYRTRYFWYREHCKLQPNWILLESIQGKQPLDNIAVLLEELANNPIYQEYKIYLSGNKQLRNDRQAYLKKKGLEHRVTLLDLESLSYYKVLATAKYLISENSLLYIYTKREGQVYFNTWHGTPLKTLGKNKKISYAMIGNEQKTFLDADYILCPNEYTMDILMQDYMLENFGQAKFLLAGYPRNTVFFDSKKREEVRDYYNLEKKQVIAYLPTWKEVMGETTHEVQKEKMQAFLAEWDNLLSDSQVLYVKLHYANAFRISLEQYKHIYPFPEEYGTYEFLTAVDSLVTDYSSVMFDYALTRRKIVLFTYDKEEYGTYRGLHIELSELPFPKADTIAEVMAEVNTPKQYEDAGFLATFCAYDNKNVTTMLCKKVILEETSAVRELDIPYNGKKNVMFYIGGFEKNGLTTAALNLLHNLNREKYNYGVVYCMNSLRAHPEELKLLPEDMPRFGYYYFKAAMVTESIPYFFWKEIRRLPYSFIQLAFERMSTRGGKRIFGDCRIHHIVQFTGYVEEMIGIVEQMLCGRSIYVHSDMEKEIQMRGNANKGLLSHAYKAYDNVAVITEGMIAPTKRIAQSVKERGLQEPDIHLCNNVIDYKRIRRMGEQPLSFDASTVFNVPKEQLLKALNSKKKKFVSIGRFSVEKGHERLIRAFEQLHKEQPDTCLIIIGGHGVLYEKTVKQVAESSCPDSIFLVRYMSNPYPLLKQCDYFALSSLYEGFGLVLVEADVLGLPCFSVNITGPRFFMEKYGGMLVEDSQAGILDGMRACIAGTVPKQLNIDYEQYNKEAVAQFETLVK